MQNRSRGHIRLGWIRAERGNAIGECRAMREQVCQAARSRRETDKKWKSRRCNREVIDRAQILAHTVDTIAAANRSGVTAGYVISKTDARLPHRGVLVAQCGLIEGAANTGEAELVDALGIHIRLPGRVRQRRIRVAGMAKRVIRRAEKLVSETEIESKSLRRTKIVLREPGIAGDAIVVVAQAATAFADERISL